MRIRPLARNIATTPAALLAATLQLISPVTALCNQNSQGNQDEQRGSLGNHCSGNQDIQGTRTTRRAAGFALTVLALPKILGPGSSVGGAGRVRDTEGAPEGYAQA